MSRFTSLTSLWQDSTLLVSSCSWVRISHSATVVSSWRSPRCSSSSLALRFILITLTCFCRLCTYILASSCAQWLRSEHIDTRTKASYGTLRYFILLPPARISRALIAKALIPDNCLSDYLTFSGSKGRADNRQQRTFIEGIHIDGRFKKKKKKIAQTKYKCHYKHLQMCVMSVRWNATITCSCAQVKNSSLWLVRIL